MSGSKHLLRSSPLFSLVVASGAIAFLIAGCPIIPDNNTNTNTNTNTNNNTNDNSAKGDSGLTGAYIGSERCSLCHNNVHNDWSQTLHAKAYDTLESIGQQNNAACVGCHTVGFGQPGGFVNRATTNSLAGVGCESCHGPGRAHAENANDESLRPKINISSNVCGACHTGTHHPNFEDWASSKHGAVDPELVPRFAAGQSLNSCGKCHSGDYFYHAIIRGDTVPDTLLQGKTAEEMNAITCVICHNPHAKTNNAATPDDGRDYQLRFPQIAFTTPTNTIEAAQDASRFNLCGQCHHARDRVWTDSSREPHPSDQVNVFFGEMPMPTAFPDPIVPSRVSVHLNAPEQCSTCHVYRAPFVAGLAPAVSGHKFEVNFGGCIDCHGTEEIAQAKLDGLKVELEIRSNRVKAALDAWSDQHGLFWEYTSEGGPNAAGQARIPNDIKKARYIYYYVIAGGGNGAHNPDYVREALMAAEEYALNAPAPAP